MRRLLTKLSVGIFLGVLCFGGIGFAQEACKEKKGQEYKQCKHDECMKTCSGDAKFCDCKCRGGTVLNTEIPFIGRCIKKTSSASGEDATAGNAFPKLMSGLMRVVMAAVVIVGFLAILVGGFMIASGGVQADLVNKGKDLIIKVIAGLALVGLSGVILNLINPNFFRTNSQSAAGIVFVLELPSK